MEGERLADSMTSDPLALARASIHPEEVVSFAQDVIRMPSVTGSEGELGHHLARVLEQADLDVNVQEVAPDRHNVLAVRHGTETTLGLLFHAHMDTIAPGAMRDPFSGEIDKDHIWGRGSVDQKGGLVAAASALSIIARSDIRLRRGIGLALVIDEESEHRGSMALVESLSSSEIPVEQAIVTEPSGLRLVIGCKGTVPYQIRVEGKAAHGARPWLGVNAIEHSARVLSELYALEYAAVEIPDYGSVQGSLNLGVIEGGRAYNVVPDECLMWFDRRIVPGETQESALAEVQDVLDKLGVAELALKASLSVARPDWNWEPIQKRGLLPAFTPEGAALRVRVARQHQDVVGSLVETYFTDGYNEMDFLINDLGIPTVQYGPGDNTLCHTDDERLSITELLHATHVYLALALEAAV